MSLTWVFTALALLGPAAHKSGMAKDRLNDIPDERIEALRDLDPQLPPFAWNIAVRFHPRSVPPAQWQIVRAFVIEIVIRMRPRTPDVTRRMMNMVGGFSAWAWATVGCRIAVESMFTPSNINAYVNGHLSGVSDIRRWDVNRQLATVAKTLVAVDVPQLTRPTFAGRGRIFTSAEIAQMHSWATSLSTEIKRQNACAILGLAAGAGLSSGEVVRTRVEHISSRDDLLLVDVEAPRGRTVPVLRQWKRTLQRAIGGRESGLLFTGYRWDGYPPKALQDFLSHNPAPVRPSLKDLRRGWVVGHLDAGVPPRILANVGGFASLAGLNAYVAYQGEVDAADHYAMLAGVGSR